MNVSLLILYLINFHKETHFEVCEKFREDSKPTLCFYHTSDTILMKSLIRPPMHSMHGIITVKEKQRVIRTNLSFTALKRPLLSNLAHWRQPFYMHMLTVVISLVFDPIYPCYGPSAKFALKLECEAQHLSFSEITALLQIGLSATWWDNFRWSRPVSIIFRLKLSSLFDVVGWFFPDVSKLISPYSVINQQIHLYHFYRMPFWMLKSN